MWPSAGAVPKMCLFSYYYAQMGRSVRAVPGNASLCWGPGTMGPCIDSVWPVLKKPPHEPATRVLKLRVSTLGATRKRGTLRWTLVQVHW